MQSLPTRQVRRDCVGGGTYAVISGSAADDLRMHLVFLPLSPALGALGGYLRSRQAARIA
jgi:hypothetical protein